MRADGEILKFACTYLLPSFEAGDSVGIFVSLDRAIKFVNFGRFNPERRPAFYYKFPIMRKMKIGGGPDDLLKSMELETGTRNYTLIVPSYYDQVDGIWISKYEEIRE